jgi:hypothetical protein
MALLGAGAFTVTSEEERACAVMLQMVSLTKA